MNQILPPSARIPLFYAKGNYFSYKGPGLSRVSHLLYPCPDTTSPLAGLGTHLTLNLAGEVRFGPDIEWIPASLDSEGEDEQDFWTKHLVPHEERLEGVLEAVQNYLPGVRAEGFSPDCEPFLPSPGNGADETDVGIRPKLSNRGEPTRDFVIEESRPGFISLLGIESPGTHTLTVYPG